MATAASCAASRRRRTRASGWRAARAMAVADRGDADGCACRARGRRPAGAERRSPTRPAAERTKATMKVRTADHDGASRRSRPRRAPCPSWRSCRRSTSGSPGRARRCAGSRAARPRLRRRGAPPPPSTAPACRRRVSAPSGGPGPRAGTGALIHAISLARCSLPGSVSATGTKAVVRPTPPSSSAGTPARRAMRSSHGRGGHHPAHQLGAPQSVSMSCGSTLRLTIEVPGESTMTCDRGGRDLQVAALSFGGNSGSRRR